MKGKIAVVTGAAVGIGKATAERFAREGASVVLADRDDAQAAADAIRTSGGAALAVRADVSDESQVAALFERALEAYGRVDVLVNNAGIAHRVLVPEASLEDWERVMGDNLRSVFLCCRSAIPAMRRAGGGSIVNIGSEFSLIGGSRNGIYAATKGAVAQLTRCLAVDHAADGIRVNCVCPGPVDTPLLRRGVERAPDPEAMMRAEIGSTLLGRLGRPEEIASVIAFVASDEASFMTGSIVVVDGGVTAR